MKKLAPLSFIFFAGCATWFPAAVQEMEPGVYKITATGNSFASLEEMKAKVNKKAEEKCEGKGYQHVKDPGVDFKQQKDYTTGATSNYKQAHITITCNK